MWFAKYKNLKPLPFKKTAVEAGQQEQSRLML